MKAISRKKRSRYRSRALEISQKTGTKIDLDDWEQIWSLIQEHGETEYLYAVADGSLVKFGKSVNPGQRLKSMQTSNGNKLRLLAFCTHQSPFTERETHDRLKSLRVSGEWFKLNPESESWISNMRRSYG